MKPNPMHVISRLHRSAWALPLAALAALVVFGINEAAYNRSQASLQSASARAEAQTQIERVWRQLLDAETGQRGFLLTGRPQYLEPFQAATSEVPGTLAGLRRRYANDAQAAPLLEEMVTQATGKLSELRTTLEMHGNSRLGNWRELLLTDIGREKMDAFRRASAQLLALETQRVELDRNDVVASVRMGRLGINVMAALSLLGLLLFLRQTLSFDRAQARHAQELLAERSRLEAEVERRTADLTELARHLQTAREDEKSRLARELHDELGALLTAAKLDSARLKRMMGPVPAELDARLQHLNETINRGIELKRRIIEDLSPSSLRTLGLVGALEILTREFSARSDTPVHEDLAPVELADSAQITAYRLVQEALTNAAKYAAASEITVSLKPATRDGREGATVSVRDNGRGFDPTARRGSAHGLMGMRYRVEAEGGALQLQSARGQGTCIEAWLPAPPAGETAVATAALAPQTPQASTVG